MKEGELGMKIENKSRKSSVASGFSLIEVLFSLLIFSIGIVGVLSLMLSSTKNEIISRDQVIAAQLVQEGIELTRNLADNKYALVNGASYRIDYLVDSGNANGRFSSNSDKRLYLKNSFYSHDSTGTATKFYRQIEISTPAPGQIMIKSTVFWGNTSGVFPADCNIGNKCETANSIIVDSTSYTP